MREVDVVRLFACLEPESSFHRARGRQVSSSKVKHKVFAGFHVSRIGQWSHRRTARGFYRR